MERIVFGISKMNFEPNYEDVLTENRPPNFCTTTTVTSAATSGTPLSFVFNYPTRSPTFSAMSNATATITASTASTIPTDTSPVKSTNSAYPPADELDTKLHFDCSVVAEEDDDDYEDKEDEDCMSSISCGSKMTACFSQRRKMPSRVSKENSLLKIKRRSIMKPTKKTIEISTLRPADIKKIYMTKSLCNFRPTNLETIYEEPQTENCSMLKQGSGSSSSSNSIDQLRFTGIKKLRRSLSCSDGLNVNKTLIKQRRAKIKRTFGRRFALKKIALDDFLEHFNKSIEEGERRDQVPAIAEEAAVLEEAASVIMEQTHAMDE